LKKIWNKTEGSGRQERVGKHEVSRGHKKKEGVKTTASGLQYKVVKEGTGAQPKANDTVTVNYRGTLHQRHGVRHLI